MSLRNKVEAMERKIGKSDDPLVVHLITYFENENGEPDTKVRKSVVIYENGQSEFLEPEEHETFVKS